MTVDCYKLKVWKLQCKYSKLAEKYSNGLSLGITSTGLLDCLKTFKSGLSILNRYDTRDIPGETSDYNSLNYTTIVSILETLTKKY